MNITVIGAGNMGGALIKGWTKAVSQDEADCKLTITVTAKTLATLDKINAEIPGVKTLTNNREAVRDADVIVLAVKPWLIEPVLKEIRTVLNLEKQTIVSVAANISTTQICEWLGCLPESAPIKQANVFCAMPNIAAEFGQSMTFITPAQEVTKEKVEEIVRLFEKVGCVKVCEERLFAPGMMMAGCGIAYVMRFIRAMMEGGVEMGFYPKDAQQIAMQTMQGAVTLLKESGEHPETAIDRVTTPGGVTIKGLNELDHASFNSAIIRCLKAGLIK